MLNFKKLTIVKVISCIVITAFVFNDTVYSMSLRTPVGKSMSRIERTVEEVTNYSDKRSRVEIEKEMIRYIADLKNEDHNIRIAAVKALGLIGPIAKEAIPYLIEALKDEDSDVRESAYNVLKKLNALTTELKVKKYIADLKDWHARVSAVEELGEIGPEAKEAIPYLIEALKNIDEDDVEDGYIREAAAKALGQIGPASAPYMRDLIKTLEFKDWRVRESVVEALGRIDSEKETMNKQKMQKIEDSYQATDNREGRNVGPGGMDKEIERYIVDLKDEDKRISAAYHLGEIGSVAEKAVPYLIEALRNSHWAWDTPYLTAEDLTKILVKIGPVSIPYLIEALEDRDSDVRVAVSNALEKFNALTTELRIVEYIATFKDKNAGVRVTAAQSLATKIGPKAVPYLIEALDRNKNDSDVRIIIVYALGLIGSEAKEAVPALMETLKDGDSDLRRAITEALEKLKTTDGRIGRNIGPGTENLINKIPNPMMGWGL